MNIHEYQAKELLVKRGVAFPPGEVCETAEQTHTVAARLAANVEIEKLAKPSDLLAGHSV